MTLSREQFHFFLFTCFVFFLPFVHLPGYFYGYEFPKFIVFVFGVQILFFIATCFIWKKDDWRVLWQSPLTKMLCLYLFVLLIADSIGADPKGSLLGVADRYQGFLLSVTGYLLYCMVAVHTKKRIDNSSVGNIAQGVFFLLAFLITLQGCLLFFFHSGIPSYNGRVIATFGNPNALAGYLAMLLPLFLLTSRWKKEYTLALFCMIPVVVFTGSRTALLLVGVFAFYLLFYCSQQTKKKRVLFFGLLCGVIAIASVGLWQANRVSLWDARDQLLFKSLIAIKDGPLLGYGQGNFRFAYPKDKLFPYDTTHNIFLDHGIAAGIPGMIVLISVLWIALCRAPLPTRLTLLSILIFGQLQPLSLPHIALLWYVLGLANSEGKKKLL